ncbi:MAG: hypothetical protein FWH07_07840 [Oscillospiraceae bacterium]|nr:hypothetical protein [Oscillospiraceae bacterium]
MDEPSDEYIAKEEEIAEKEDEIADKQAELAVANPSNAVLLNTLANELAALNAELAVLQNELDELAPAAICGNTHSVHDISLTFATLDEVMVSLNFTDDERQWVGYTLIGFENL